MVEREDFFWVGAGEAPGAALDLLIPLSTRQILPLFHFWYPQFFFGKLFGGCSQQGEPYEPEEGGGGLAGVSLPQNAISELFFTDFFVFPAELERLQPAALQHLVVLSHGHSQECGFVPDIQLPAPGSAAPLVWECVAGHRFSWGGSGVPSSPSHDPPKAAQGCSPSLGTGRRRLLRKATLGSSEAGAEGTTRSLHGDRDQGEELGDGDDSGGTGELLQVTFLPLTPLNSPLSAPLPVLGYFQFCHHPTGIRCCPNTLDPSNTLILPNSPSSSPLLTLPHHPPVPFQPPRCLWNQGLWQQLVRGEWWHPQASPGESNGCMWPCLIHPWVPSIGKCDCLWLSHHSRVDTGHCPAAPSQGTM